jgi:nucleotide-binding universal stress UspA family protein
VIQRFHKTYFDGPVNADPEEIANVEAQWLARTKEIVDAVKLQAEKKGVKAKSVTVKSDLISDAIIATAKKQNCDLIVMASHGRKGIKRLILGSETQHVLTHTEIPVLVLR